jgi:hypothetical protein
MQKFLKIYCLETIFRETQGGSEWASGVLVGTPTYLYPKSPADCAVHGSEQGLRIHQDFHGAVLSTEAISSQSSTN